MGSAAVAARRATSWWRRASTRDAAMAYLFILPGMALYALFQGYPIVRGLVIAFSDYRYLVPDWQPFNGVQNWVEMAGDGTFWASLGRSGYFTALYVPSIVVIGILAAVLISQYHDPVEASVYRVISYLPVVLSAGILGTVEESLVFFPSEYGSRNAALLIGRYAYDTAFRLGDMRWGYAAAMNLTVGVISMLVSTVVFRRLRGERAE